MSDGVKSQTSRLFLFFYGFQIVTLRDGFLHYLVLSTRFFDGSSPFSREMGRAEVGL